MYRSEILAHPTRDNLPMLHPEMEDLIILVRVLLL